ncbi:MAG: T9SS type A sorting domain-containing protein [Bacteroidia bacterium]|nr:T9SS type A sorting domain-containing protein [Bacteroidia bacterium]
MKQVRDFSLIFFFAGMLCFAPIGAQTTKHFPLYSDFVSTTSNDTLQLLPNGSGQTGFFQVRAIPTTTCPAGGNIAGWHFQKMVGFDFLNNGFIQNEWTVSYLYQVDNLNVYTTPYVRQFGVHPTLDNGFFIDPLQGDMEGYQYSFTFFGTPIYTTFPLSPTNAISTTNIYQFTFTRNAAGLIRFYLNGALTGSFNDPSGVFLPHPVSDKFTFFQDNATGAYPNEAEPGWISDLYIADFVWPDTDIQDNADICQLLLAVPTQGNSLEDKEDLYHSLQLFPNPASDELNIELPPYKGTVVLTISDMMGKQLMKQVFSSGSSLLEHIDIRSLHAGQHIVTLTASDGQSWKAILYKS